MTSTELLTICIFGAAHSQDVRTSSFFAYGDHPFPNETRDGFFHASDVIKWLEEEQSKESNFELAGRMAQSVAHGSAVESGMKLLGPFVII